MSVRVSLPEAGMLLAGGEICILPTDTIYGFVASALLPESVERLYKARGRDERKPCIVLLSSADDIARFDRVVSSEERRILNRVWPGAVSVILSGFSEPFSYLHRGTGTIAFRVPNVSELRGMLRISGPIIAPSANPEGMKPAETIEESELYFGGRADFFVDGGRLSGLPSTVVKVENNHLSVVRQGVAKLPSAVPVNVID